MSGTLIVQNIQGPSSGANANKIIIPSGQTLDASAGFVPPAGAVLQTVEGYNSGKLSTSSTSFVSLATGPSITPTSASSKILVSVSTMVARDGSNGNVFFEVRRGTTSILQSGQACHFSHWNDYSSYTQNNTSWSGLDSPNTTSAISYQIFAKTDGGTRTAVLGGRGIDAEHNCGVLWVIQEIAG